MNDKIEVTPDEFLNPGLNRMKAVRTSKEKINSLNVPGFMIYSPDNSSVRTFDAGEYS